MENYITNIDWLAMSFRLDRRETETDFDNLLFTPPVDVKIVQYPGNNIYKHRAVFFNDGGSKLLTMLWQPYSYVIKSDLALVEIANEWLYSDLWRTYVLPILYESHPCHYHGLSRLDLAADFTPSDRQYCIMEQLISGDVYVAGKQNGSMFYKQQEDAKGRVSRIVYDINWGSHKTQFRWKLYNKSYEIRCGNAEAGKMYSIHGGYKSHIVDVWQQAGFDLANDVWRLEVSITDASKLVVSDVDVDRYKDWIAMLGDRYMIHKLFASTYQSRFVQRRNEGKSNRSRNERVWLLFAGNPAETLSPKEYDARDLDHGEDVRVMRRLIEVGDSPLIYANADAMGLLLAQMQDLYRRRRMQSWWLKCMGVDFDAWVEDRYGDMGLSVIDRDRPVIDRD